MVVLEPQHPFFFAFNRTPLHKNFGYLPDFTDTTESNILLSMRV
jgi:hypothetical protein